MNVIARNDIYYIVLQIHYMSLHRGGFKFADVVLWTYDDIVTVVYAIKSESQARAWTYNIVYYMIRSAQIAEW